MSQFDLFGENSKGKYKKIKKRIVCVFGTSSHVKQFSNEKTTYLIFNRKVHRSKLHEKNFISVGNL